MECLIRIDERQQYSVDYDNFCDRLEQEMLPYIIRHQDEIDHADFNGQGSHSTAVVELKLPYMAIVEQRIEQEELAQNDLQRKHENQPLSVAEQVYVNRTRPPLFEPATGDFRDNIALIKQKAKS